ncbi:ArsC/Spx/MgsR family protein [Citrobacter freundii]|uniref:ArsC/Spx/MgsR family protein n=2 Tax=Citrobacter freundii TaxID=546 RepID=UPI0021B7F54F|nr:ArsC/Spx/MgsR family protein [Citrobacter freundii]
MFPGQCGNTAFFFKSQPDQFHFEFRGIVFPGKSFFSAHEVSTCKISGCLSYRILDSGPDGTQTTLTEVLGLVEDKFTDDQLIDFMLQHTILINRPIVVTPLGTKLCRPSEEVLDILPERQKGAFTKEDGEKVIGETGKRVK